MAGAESTEPTTTRIFVSVPARREHVDIDYAPP
jgi:hypothetical protein